MSDKNDKPDFDFQRLLHTSDGPNIHSRLFAPIGPVKIDPNHIKHEVVVRHYLSHMPLPGDQYGWDKAVRDCAALVQKFDTKAADKLQAYSYDFTTVVNAIVHTYEDRHSASENEMALQHAYIDKAWETLNNSIDYFRKAHPTIAKHSHVTDFEEFQQGLPSVFEAVHERLIQPETSAAHLRQVTRVGERARYGRVRGMSRSEATQWAESVLQAEADEARKGAMRHEPAMLVRMSMQQVQDPVSGTAWFNAFSNAAVEYASTTLGESAGGSVSDAINQLHHSWRRLENSLIIYAEILRNNYLHPENRQPTDGPFNHLADSVAELLQQLPHDHAKLPSRRQFCKLRLAMEAAACEAVEQEKGGQVERIESQRNAKDSGGAGHPSGRR